ncbi:hypothetical protein D9M70_463190 [compost metagenome]
MPTGVKSNMLNGRPVSSSRIRETTMFGDVPTRVMSPPSKEPNAIGMRRDEGEAFDRRAIWNATGIIIASAPMCLMKMERTETVVTRITT